MSKEKRISDASFKPRVGTRKLPDLMDFPNQSEIYPSLPEHEEIALADDIRRNGLREPIDLIGPNAVGLDPNTIMDGHRRAAAQERNGEITTPVRIPHDFRHADWPTILSAFVRINLQRRQLSTVARARCLTKLFLGDKSLHSLNQSAYIRLTQFLAKSLGMSSKNARRYMRLLMCPLAIQQAVEADKVGVVLIQPIAFLSEQEHTDIAAAIDAGEDPKAVVLRYTAKQSGRAKKGGTAVMRFIRHLQRGNEELEGFSVADSAGSPLNNDVEILKTTQRVISEIIRAFNRNTKKSQAAYKKFFGP